MHMNMNMNMNMNMIMNMNMNMNMVHCMWCARHMCALRVHLARPTTARHWLPMTTNSSSPIPATGAAVRTDPAFYCR